MHDPAVRRGKLMQTVTRHTNTLQAPLADLSLERGALGAAMLAPAQAHELIRKAQPGFFVATIHRAIFQAICTLGPKQLDYTLLIGELERQGQGVAWDVIAHLDDGVVIEVEMEWRIKRLAELYRLRQLACLGETGRPSTRARGNVGRNS